MGRQFDPAFWALAALGVIAAIVYGRFFLNRRESVVRALVKTGMMASFAAAFSLHGAFPPLLIAFAGSALGDFFLAFSKKWTLPLGILCFFAAQIAYFAIFLAMWMFSGDNAPLWPRYTMMVLLALVVLAYLSWFWNVPELKRAPLSGRVAVACFIALGAIVPFIILAVRTLLGHDQDEQSLLAGGGVIGFVVFCGIIGWVRRDLGALKLAAMTYAGAILLMVVQSLWVPWAGWPVMIGAMLFLLSDLALAAELFRLPADAPIRELTRPLVWWTYAGAQILIVAGILLMVMHGHV